MTDTTSSAKWVGQSLRRVEDERLLIGLGNYTSDISRPGLLRSPHAHARIVSIDTREAEALPGVLAVMTGEELARRSNPFVVVFPSKMLDYPMEFKKVR